MPSIREIARRAGVSSSTASRALNDDPSVRSATRDKVVAAANEAKYVATIGRRVKTNVALLYTGPRTIRSTYDAALISGIMDGLDESELDLVILNLARDKKAEESYSQFFRRKSVTGVFVGATTSTRSVCLEIARERFPMIALGERFEEEGVNFVGCNSEGESRTAIDHLIALGHKRIAFCMNSVPDCDHLDRLKGYKDALSVHNLQLDERLVLRQQASYVGGASALKIMLRIPDRPTAVYFADPVLAIGAMNAAHQMALRIPRDFSVVGFDDAEVRHSIHPNMTAVCQDANRIGLVSGRGMVDLVRDGNMEIVRETMQACFEVNGTVGYPPADTAVSPKNVVRDYFTGI